MRLFTKTAMAVMTGMAVFCAQAEPGDTDAPKQPIVEKKNAAPAKKQEKTADTLVVVAQLAEVPGAMPPNDLYNYVYMMKYRIMKVEKGAYKGSDILVGVYNPLIPRKQIADAMRANAAGDVAKFTVGDKHRLFLITPIEKIWKDAVEDEYVDSDLTKYYAVRTDAVK